MARSEHHPNGLIHYNPQLSWLGYTLFTADYNTALLMDVEGRFVHRWRYPKGITNAELLPNGNVLICETAKGQFFEVSRDKKVVWEYINPFFSGNPRLGGRMNLVFRAHRYGLDHPAIADKDLDPDPLQKLKPALCILKRL